MLTFDEVHQCDDFLGKGPSVHGGLLVRPRVLQHGQEVQTLATHVDQVERELPVCRVTKRAAEEEAEEEV